jgi:hypothetical protein
MCTQSDGDFQAFPYQSSSEGKGCPNDTELVQAQNLRGTVNQVRWLLAATGMPAGTVFYVGE